MKTRQIVSTIPNKLIILYSLFVSFCLTFSTASYAHRGAVGEVDACRIKVGYEKIHFTAYTPKFSKTKGYCQFIPNVGFTSLVFDYEGKKLRNISIEYEITKEPEGTRVFYQKPQKIKTGNMTTNIDFSKYGMGDYLAHITIIHKGEKLDSHLPFSVGVEEPKKTPWHIYFILIVIVLMIAFFVKLSKATPVGTQDSGTND